ncbi:MAG: ABC transporter ATP-binding protein [Anaerolineae bacterium]
MTDANGIILECKNLVAGYGKLQILHGVNLHVKRGEIVCVIGPNGAGKSTVFKTIYGFLQPDQGSIRFDGQDITGHPPEMILRYGLSLVPQVRSTFPQMTVRENLEMGAFIDPAPQRLARGLERAFTLFPRLAEREKQLAGTMSGGEQRMLEIARALMLDPKMILLDEPSAGLAPLITQLIFERLQALNAEGVTVMIVEQNARQGLSISDRGYVLDVGRNRFEGTGQDLLNDEQVRHMYLGG